MRKQGIGAVKYCAAKYTETSDGAKIRVWVLTSKAQSIEAALEREGSYLQNSFSVEIIYVLFSQI